MKLATSRQRRGKRVWATLFAGAAALAVAAVLVPVAAATPPTTADNPITGTVTLAAGTLCSFPIDFTATGQQTTTTFFDDGGAITKRIGIGTEQDTFSANGKTLVGEPYHFQFIAEFENGVRVSRFFEGGAERVQLPDGGVFIVAGRVDFNVSGIILAVDFGNSGNNADAFCAALS